ncbi:unnamed protein product [Vitrella brassicaformis CCMP3155]|uniref:Uncharacterized protein n=1 Tax=Vitrella brassicaformis (strain CCMP3155) TaxID=1169540 RepID=A0A0G4FQ71_VITBC|nr:unnamed protein product [Vitrella brassicaformis CCMP3155]|eukprot:CEM16579.1 unnamed protein product [Vitrella brassicaformis CCMP3155]
MIGLWVCVVAASVMMHPCLRGQGWQVARLAVLVVNDMLTGDKSTTTAVMLTGLLQLLCIVAWLVERMASGSAVPPPSRAKEARESPPPSTTAHSTEHQHTITDRNADLGIPRTTPFSPTRLFSFLRPPSDLSARQEPFKCHSKARDMVPIGFTPTDDGVYLTTDQDRHANNYADTQTAASRLIGQALHTMLGSLQWGPIDVCSSLMRQIEASPIMAHTVTTEECLLSLPFDEARGWGVAVYPLLNKGLFGGMSLQRGMGGGKREATHCGVVIGTPERLINGVGHVGRASRLGVFVEWERMVKDCERESIMKLAQGVKKEGQECLLVGLLPLSAMDIPALFPSPLHPNTDLLSCIISPDTPPAPPPLTIQSLWHSFLEHTGCFDGMPMSAVTGQLPAKAAGVLALGMVAQEKREHDHKTREVDTAASATPVGGGGGGAGVGVWCDANTVDGSSESELEGGVSEEAVTDQEGKCAEGGVSDGEGVASACLFEAAFLAAYVLLLSGIWQPIQVLLFVVFTVTLPPTTRPLLSAVPLGGLIMTIIVATHMTCGGGAVKQTATLISGWLTVVLVSLASSGANTDGGLVVRGTCVLAGSVAALALWTNLYMALPAMPILSIISSCWFPLFGVTIASGTAKWLTSIDYGGAD